MVLHETLMRLAVLASPIIPYISEEIYQALDRRELSVHMVKWPEVQAARIAEGAEKNMSIAKQVMDVDGRFKKLLSVVRARPLPIRSVCTQM